MSEFYTPDTDDVRACYAGARFISGYGEKHRLNREAAFERWLNQVKAEAFDEGVDAENATFGPHRPTNPYKKEEA